jgi:hypothetical protein
MCNYGRYSSIRLKLPENGRMEVRAPGAIGLPRTADTPKLNGSPPRGVLNFGCNTPRGEAVPVAMAVSASLWWALR